MCSNIPASPAYGVYISQLIRFARASSNYFDFLKRHLHLRNRLLDQGYTKIRLIRSLKKFIFRYQDLVEIYSVYRKDYKRWIFIKWKCIKIRCQQKCQKYFFCINVWHKIVFDIYFTEFVAAFTTVLLVLFNYCYKYCYSDSRKLWAVMKGGGLAL
jgi:hypothetical protein